MFCSVTLDRCHLLAVAEAVRQAGLSTTVLRPGDFIRLYYPQHEDYPTLPPTRG